MDGSFANYAGTDFSLLARRLVPHGRQLRDPARIQTPSQIIEGFCFGRSPSDNQEAWVFLSTPALWQERYREEGQDQRGRLRNRTYGIN